MAWMSRLYPRGPIDLGSRAWVLPADGRLPVLPGWRWVHTPGHTPGHISLVRDADRMVIAGDAVITTKQESFMAVATQRRQMHGPPAYFTQDWRAAAASVRAIAALEPSALITGHGRPMAGPHMRAALERLAERFEAEEIPSAGRYVRTPAVASEWGTEWVPPDPLPRTLALAAVPTALAVCVGVWAMKRREMRRAELGART
jgi:glyoxylase-like metal-dependent hydrolase (beta-lactamase superfamily II)